MERKLYKLDYYLNGYLEEEYFDTNDEMNDRYDDLVKQGIRNIGLYWYNEVSDQYINY